LNLFQRPCSGSGSCQSPEVNVDYTEGAFLLLLLRTQFILRTVVNVVVG